MRTFSPTHIVAGLLFCLGSLSPLPAAAAGEAELGDLLVKMIQAGRTVMAKHQVEINNPDLVDKGFTPRYDYALQMMQEIPYNRWREYDPEDTVRFYALRLHEIGLIKSTPQKIIAQGTDWRFFNALKKELKG